MQLEVLHQSPRGTAKETPIVFVHGAWHGAWCWEENFMPYFAEQGYESYALSLRGHGRSPGNLRWASLRDYVQDVHSVVSQLDTKPVLVGHSMGGLVTQKYLQFYSDQVSAAVLLASMPINGGLPFFVRYVLKYPIPALRVMLTLDPQKFIDSQELAQSLFFSSHVNSDDIAVWYGQMNGESVRLFLDAGLLDLPAAQRYPLPMLVLGSIRDAIFTREEIKMTARAYGTDAEFFNMAHDMMLEPGWIAVADRIIRWLQSKDL